MKRIRKFLAAGVLIGGAALAGTAQASDAVLGAVVGGYERRDDPDLAWRAAPSVWQPVAAALTVAGRAGVAPGPLLLAAAGAILRRESSAQEAALGRVSVRLVLPLGLALLPAFMCTTVIPLVLVMTRGYLGP